MSVDQRETRVVVTQRQIKQVVSAGTQGPRGGAWEDWDAIPGKPDFPALYDPLGAADDAEAAAATDASAKDAAHVAAPDPHPQYATDSALSDHAGNTANPHAVTKVQVGLGNVDNTSDANKPVSTAQQAALNGKMSSAEVSALPVPSSASKQMRVLAANNRCYWSDGTTWIDLTATGGRSAEFAGMEAETYALIAARTTHPSSARATVINTLIASLKSAGVWSKLGLLYMLAAGDEQAARLNWKSPGVVGTLTAVNSPTFTADRGFSGDGVSSYLDTLIAVSGLPVVSQDSVSLSAWVLNETANGAPSVVIGQTGSTSRIYMALKNGTGRMSVGLRSAAVASSAVVSTSIGFSAATRNSPSAIRVLRGALDETLTSASDATTVANTVTILRNSSSYGSGQVSFAAVGSGLSAGEVTALQSSVQTYLQAVGAVA